MEALPAARAVGLERLRTAASPLLRLRSDEQLVTRFRLGNDEAFTTIHDRHRTQLIAYARRMLGDSADVEDLVQDVFLEAFRALRRPKRPVSLRAWLYGVAHNRCVDQLERRRQSNTGVVDVSPPIRDTSAEVERREEVRLLLADMQRLTDRQRSALLMREVDGMSYEELADALGLTTVAAVRSLLVRARLGLVETMTARDTDCEEIRQDLLETHDRGARTSRRARQHLCQCEACASLHQRLFAVRRSLAALSPGAPSLAKLVGFGGGVSTAGGSGAMAGGGLSLGLGKVTAALLCTAALTGTALATRDEGARPAQDTPARHRTQAARDEGGRAALSKRAAGGPGAVAKAPSTPTTAGPATPTAAPPTASAVTAAPPAPEQHAAAGIETPPATSLPATPQPTTTASVAATEVAAPAVNAASQVLAATTSAVSGVVAPVVSDVTGALLPPKKQ